MSKDQRRRIVKTKDGELFEWDGAEKRKLSQEEAEEYELIQEAIVNHYSLDEFFSDRSEKESSGDKLAVETSWQWMHRRQVKAVHIMIQGSVLTEKELMEKVAALKAKKAIEEMRKHVKFCERDAEAKKAIEEMHKLTNRYRNTRTSSSSATGSTVVFSGLTENEKPEYGCPPDNPSSE